MKITISSFPDLISKFATNEPEATLLCCSWVRQVRTTYGDILPATKNIRGLKGSTLTETNFANAN